MNMRLYNLLTIGLAGTTVVSYVYELAGWSPEAVFQTHPHMTEDGTSPLYVYKVPVHSSHSSSGAFLERLKENLHQQKRELENRSRELRAIAIGK
jgi:hypothetical protein